MLATQTLPPKFFVQNFCIALINPTLPLKGFVNLLHNVGQTNTITYIFFIIILYSIG